MVLFLTEAAWRDQSWFVALDGSDGGESLDLFTRWLRKRDYSIVRELGLKGGLTKSPPYRPIVHLLPLYTMPLKGRQRTECQKIAFPYVSVNNRVDGGSTMAGWCQESRSPTTSNPRRSFS